MKKFIVLILFAVISTVTYAQYTTVANESFTSIPAGWSMSPSSSWALNNGLSVSSPNSVMGFIPNSNGDSIELISPWYNLTSYAYAFLQFSHICKVTGSDLSQIKYQELAMPGWKVIPTSSYLGKDPTAYAGAKFTQSSYGIWQPGDSLAIPTNSWWKEESFDVSGEVSYAQVRFKFVIKKGNVLGSQFAYGWLIDNFKLLASMNEIKPPVVEFLSSSPIDTVYNTGPFTVTAKIATRTLAPIVQPVKLNVKYVYNNITTYDTLSMTMVAGDSIFSAVIPQKLFGTKVSYDVHGMDSVGNDAYAYSGFYIKRAVGGGVTGYVIIGTQVTTNNYNILYYNYDYGWSKQLYLGAEINSFGTGGLITRIAFKPNSTWNITSQSCYFKAVDDVVIPTTNYTDPAIDGYTLVWTGSYNVTANSWSEISLTTPFLLPPGKNLMVYWLNYEGSYTNNTSTVWSSTSTSPSYRAVYKYQDASFPATAGTFNYYRPDIRMYVQGGSDDSNSVALYSINQPGDSVVAAPAHQVPVIVTIKNKGFSNLDSCYINWALNGVPQTSKKWTGNLPDDFNATDTIGYYSPSVNLYDTLIIWTSLPNGVYDSTSFDDTLMRVAFGVPDLAMGFTTDQGDTVYNTGPFEVIAQIYSRLGATLPSPIKLKLTYINGMVYTYDSLVMNSIGNDLYKIIIPQHIFGTDVHYSLTLQDVLGNTVSIRDSFYIKRINGGGVVSNDSIQVGNELSGGNNCLYPFCVGADSTRTRTLYFASEIGNITNAVVMSGIAFYNPSYSVFNLRANQKCYLKAVSDVALTASASIDPVADGATLVYTGSYTTQLLWNKFTFDRPFVLPAGSNLMVYWVDNAGTCNSNNIYWRNNSASVNRAESHYTRWNCSSTGTGLTAYQIVAIFYFGGGGTDDTNSVGLLSIDNPTQSVTAGQTTPVITTIKNKGIANLTSCTINWMVNGVLRIPINWTGNLPEDFNHTDTIGNYIPRNAMFDTIRIWVSNPNNAYDSVHYDDTLEIITFGCAQVFSGNIIVGPDTATSDFESLNALIAAMNLCGATGNIHVNMQSGTYAENVNIPDLSATMGTDTLFITSIAGDADSVIFQPSAGAVMTLNGAKNVYISHITLNATLGTYGMQFLGSCSNIEVKGCNIINDPYTTLSSTAGIYYNNSSGSGKYLANVRFIKNTISGGYYNMYFYYPGSSTSTISLSSITIDSNILKDAYYAGIYHYYYGNYPSISYNTITSRLNTNSTYYGIYFSYYSNILKLNGNRIKVTGTSTCYGMYLYYYLNNPSYGGTVPGTMYNNEIIVLGGSTTAYGVYMYYSSFWNMTHNTIYAQGTSTVYGLYRNNTTTGTPMNVNRNIFVTKSSSTNYPLYISSATYGPVAYGSLNYNNYYGSGSAIAYVGTDINTISALKLVTTQDTNSINIKPNFIDSSSNLDLVSYTGFDCPQDASVVTNIVGSQRLTTTTMGAYSMILVNINANLKEVLGWDKKAMTGRIFGVTAVLQNDGIQNLTSATINWSFNNVVQTPVSWTGNLALGQSTNVYLGNVTFLSGDSNDLVVWVSNPNSAIDMYPINDTLTLSSVGGPGMIVEFISPFVVDTLLGNIGPYEIRARVKRLSQQPLTTPVLNVYTLWQGTPSTANITMTAISGDSLWKASIPQKAYGSFVQYSITAYDSLGAMATDTDWFYVKRLPGGANTGYVIVGTGTSTGYDYPMNMYWCYSWTRELYMAKELNASSGGGMITKLAWQYAYSSPYTYTNQTCYFKAVDDTVITNNAFIDPTLNGATQVWTGTINLSQGWVEITLAQPFILLPNKNLLIFWHHMHGTYPGTAYTFYYTSTSRNMAVGAYSDSGFPSASSGTLTTNRPNARFYIIGLGNDSNSVALAKIVSPKDTVPCFKAMPIKVVIKNKGIKNLTSCNIEWTWNGVAQTTYHWTGNLAEDFIDTVVLASYMPSFGVKDSFKIWVSLPNGVHDSTNYDDTLIQKSLGYYTGGFIAGKEIIAPVNGANDVCFAEKSALKVKLNNSGTRTINLTMYPITFYYKITGAVNVQGMKIFNTGFFGKTDKEFVLDTIDIRTSGTYTIEVYFYCGDDVYNEDDTLRGDYQVKTILLPYDNNFSVMSPDFTITNSGASGWYLDTDAVMTPVYGTGLMRMEPASGLTSTMTFNAINLTGSSYPTMEFWFAHDNQSPASQDRINVSVSNDGGTTFTTLHTYYRYKASAVSPVWANYVLDLSDYTNESCLIFAINGISSGGGDLYIDRVKINSNPEIGVSAMDVQSLTNLVACDLNHKSLSVTLKNNTIQDLDFSVTPVDITIVVSNAVNQTYTKSLTTGIVSANSEDTYVVETDFDYSATGTFDFKAYVGSIDKFDANDTLYTTITISPDVSIDSMVNTGCEMVGTPIYKTIYIKNEGNMSVSNIPIRIQVDGSNDITETAAITLLVGERKSYTLTTAYTVPLKSDFVLSVSAELSCDVNTTNDKDTMTHCTIEPSVKVTGITDPSTSPCDHAKSKKYAAVILNNTSTSAVMNQIIFLEIDDHNGNVVTLKDTALYLNPGITNYRFDKAYTVPDLSEGSNYKVTSYVYAPVYGSSVEACVTTVGIPESGNESWTMGQNIPNPVQAKTTIPYSIPEEGTLLFKVMTVTGQVLVENTIESKSGNSSLEFNTEDISNGIYYYSMEYNGQKIVKKMTIQK